MDGKTIIEVNGVKLEVDLRTATRIDTLRVGDRVKALIKGYDSYKVHAGVVVGFEPFEKRPTIIVAYVDVDFSSASIKFIHFNSDSKDVEIVKAIDNDELDVDRAHVTNLFDRQIESKKRELEDLMAKKEFFLKEFKNYWRYEAVLAE